MDRYLLTHLRGVLTADPSHPWRVHRVPDASLGVEQGRVRWLGPRTDTPSEWREARQVDGGGAWATPGFVDAHTHLLFAGDRSGEFNRRLHGATYAQIAAEGGGIRSTVAATRAASVAELVALGEERLSTLRERGVVHVEAKTGYGLELEAESRLLAAYAELQQRGWSLDLTLMPAHAVPTEYQGRPDAYVQVVTEHWLPELVRRFPGRVRYCDAFVEQGAFSREQGRRVFQAAKALGLRPRLHADQLSPGGGAELAAELGAASADHLIFCSEAGMTALARAGTVPILLPTATLFLGEHTWAPARRLVEAGCAVALASDFNPGTTPCLDPLLVLRLGCLQLRLTFEEAFTALTLHAARSLERPELGHLLPGASAQVLLWDVKEPLELVYWLGEPFRPRPLAQA
jgi:imidazolonepropionase